MVKAKRSLSQNFLKDKNICKKIIKNTTINDKIVLEIGPGYGFLTDFIIEKNPRKLILVEKDFNLIKHLNTKYKNNNNVEIICLDILNFNLSRFNDLIIISNLPYNLSTKIILYLFNYHKNLSEMILMVQKEVALKFNYNLPKMNKYKFLTKIVSTYNISFEVSPKVFIPQPKVKSSVVKFKLNHNKSNLKKANDFSNKIFKNMRKKIKNNLRLNSNNHLLNMRVNQLSIKELLEIYNFF
tara:strand:- start:288 stop:1007 length:720 start_codon:yes stop_codon:yes gene_type:complete